MRSDVDNRKEQGLFKLGRALSGSFKIKWIGRWGGYLLGIPKGQGTYLIDVPAEWKFTKGGTRFGNELSVFLIEMYSLFSGRGVGDRTRFQWTNRGVSNNSEGVSFEWKILLRITLTTVTLPVKIPVVLMLLSQ
jgi:hypothetical protein